MQHVLKRSLAKARMTGTGSALSQVHSARSRRYVCP